MNPKLRFLLAWSACVGAMDAATGLLLVAAPAFTLRLMGIAAPPDAALVFLSWMGVFVGAVGLSYVFALCNRRRGVTVWLFTSLVRLLVGVFVLTKIAGGALAPQWATVAATDLVVAGVQIAILRARWWETAKH